MTAQGGIVEQKTIGISISMDGTFSNTELVEGKIQLKKNVENSNQFYSTGFWTSKIVDIGDNFLQYGKVIVTNLDTKDSNIAVSTRTSADGIQFSAWTQTSIERDILSEKNRYIQVRILFTAGVELTENLISPEKFITNNNFTEVDNGKNVKLKKDYIYDLENSFKSIDYGFLTTKQVKKADFLKIDSLSIIRK